MSRAPIGERAMTGAERIAKWRERHAAKLARKAARAGREWTPPAQEDLDAMMVLTADDMVMWK